MVKYILEIDNVTKEFPGVLALDRVNMKIKEGEIHGIVGENGAGKSTLMKILCGVYPYGTYSGDIKINGEIKRFRNIKDSEESGIAIIYQELMLIKELTIAENIFLGRLEKFINWEKTNKSAMKWMEYVGLKENPETILKNIGVGKQQLVEIAKVLSHNAKILILDEPTSALTEADVEHLMRILKELKQRGITCIYISHKIEEVLNITDTLTIMRDGKTIETSSTSDMNEKKIISLMVGRDFSDRFPKRSEKKPGEILLEVKDLNLTDFVNDEKYILKDINFNLRSGEILGIAGLMGSGRTELLNSIFGDFRGKISGEIFIKDKKAQIKSPINAIKNGLGLLTEDKKENGLILIASVENNISLASLKKLSKFGIINENESIKRCNALIDKLRIKVTSLETPVMQLSGGNQQKVVFAKWLMVQPDILLIDEPTRGIDVGAKYEVYTIMKELKESGIGIVMVSSELPEILGMSDRIIIISEGRIVDEFENKNITEEMVMERATGGSARHYG